MRSEYSQADISYFAMYHVYFIESSATGKRYIGYTSDLRRRLKDHNERKNISTANAAPWKLVYYEAYLDKEDALGREKFLKSGSGWKFLKRQISHYLRKQLRDNSETED